MTSGPARLTRWADCPECGRERLGVLPDPVGGGGPHRPGRRLARHMRADVGSGVWCPASGVRLAPGQVQERSRVS